jgi:hypothetical protein
MCEVLFTAGGLGTSLRTFAQHKVLKRQGKICAPDFCGGAEAPPFFCPTNKIANFRN